MKKLTMCCLFLLLYSSSNASSSKKDNAEICGKKIVHIPITSDKPIIFACNFCNYEFGKSQALSIHRMLMHTPQENKSESLDNHTKSMKKK